MAQIVYDDSINGLTQPYVLVDNGQEIFRHATYSGCERFMSWHGYELSEEVEQPVKLPQVGESYFVGDFLLRCVVIGGEYAAVWDVNYNGFLLGEIRMNWSCFWIHTLSFTEFATPQEAVVGLYESAQELAAA